MNRIKQSINNIAQRPNDDHGLSIECTCLFTSTHVSPGIAYASPEPNSFSFNSPKGACSGCNGLGEILKSINQRLPNKNLSINKG